MPASRRFCRTAAAALILCMAASYAFAQPKPGYAPSATHIFPAGGRIATTVDVLVGAECIPPQTRFRMFGKGVRLSQNAANTVRLTHRVEAKHEPSPRRKPTIEPITIPREWKSSLRIEKDAVPGVVSWRLSCAQGGTELRPFVLGSWPEFIETESNSTPQTAETVTLPVTVNGRIYGERDNDYFRFSAKRGEVVVCEMWAARLKSRLDPIVELFDADGRPVRTEMAYVGRDPVLAFRAKTGGDYLLRVANVSHHGDAAHVYRVNISTKPFVRSVFPSCGRRGGERDVEYRLMTGTGKPRIVKRRVRFPAKGTESGSFRYLLKTATGTAANRVTLSLCDHPTVTEREPNDGSSPQELKLPVTVDGRTVNAEDADWFSFAAKRGRHYAIECDAPAAGSRSWPTLLLTDAKGNQLRFLRSVEQGRCRCHIDWTAPADGVYRVRVRDQQFGARGGAEFVYRLTVRRATPDFELTVPNGSINIAPDSTVHVPVTVRRFGGFEEPITLNVDGLPDGVSAKTELIEGNTKRIEIALRCGKSAACGDAQVQIVGRGRAGPFKLVRFATHNGQSQRLHLTVMHRPLFRLYCSEAYQYAHRGSVFLYPMTVQRLNGFDGEITVQAGDRQNRDMDGVEIRTVKVPLMSPTVRVPIYLPETMHINVQSQTQLYAQAYAIFTDEHGRRQSVLVLSEKRNMLRTLPPVVKLKAVKPSVTVQTGETVRLGLRLERTSNFPGPMTVALRKSGADNGFLAKPARFAAGQSRAAITVVVPKAGPAKSTRLTFRGTGKLKDGTAIISETCVTLRVQP